MKIPDAPKVEIEISGEKHEFDLDDPKLPKWIKSNALASGGFPYSEKLDEAVYSAQLDMLQEELVKVQYWLQETGGRVVALYEGRDSAGKGGSIEAFRENLNPRYVRTVALSKPSDVEAGQWYFQRYASHLPTRGEIVLFDRSWYNRAGVEPVMGFCTPEQYESFLQAAPHFESMLVDDGIHLFKFWINIGREMQLKRFHDRRHSPLRVWKLSPVDIRALEKWDAYSHARDVLLKRCHTPRAPWTVIRGNDKRRARLNSIRTVLNALDYDGKNPERIGEIDPKIAMPAHHFADPD